MMATVPHVTSGLGLRKFQADGFLLTRVNKVLVYIQTSQPTTCFGLIYLGHLQVGYNGQRNYTIMQYNH